jgi:outer membrane protein
MKRAFTLLFIGLFLFGGLIYAHAKDLKMAYVDLDKVFEEYNKTKEEYKALDNKLKQKESERKKMVDEVRRLKDELELMSDKGREEKQAVIDEKINSLTEFDRRAKDDFKKERMNAIRDISNEIDRVIQAYGTSQGYDYVFSSRALVYGQEGYDITGDILKILNAKEAAPGGKKQ